MTAHYNRQINKREQEYIQQFNSYTEYSPSSTGIHIIIMGKLPDQNRKTDNLEMFSRHHFITLTLNHVPGTPMMINYRQKALDKVLAASKRKDDLIYHWIQKEPSTDFESRILKENAYYDYLDLKNKRYADLWDGNWQRYYQTQSEADLAFCGMLLDKTGGNVDLTKELFLESKLRRDKTLSIRGNTTYLSQTIAKAYQRWKRRKE